MSLSEQYEDIILRINKEYLEIKNSDSYKFGSGLYGIIRNIRQGNIKSIFEYIKQKEKSIRIRLHSKPFSRKEGTGIAYKGERIAVYTVLFGKYDRIVSPVIRDENCDYYIITDQEVPENSLWKKKEIDFAPLANMDNIQKNRYFKMMPHKVFDEYKFNIYVDANILIYGKISDLISRINPKTGIALHNLPHKSSVYEEIYAREIINPKDKTVLKLQKKKYRCEGFKSGDGMFECNVIVRENCLKCNEIMNAWWEEFRRFPKRDQISFPYILWKKGISQEDIGILGENIRENPYFRLMEHV